MSKIENLQRNFTSYISGVSDLNYWERLNTLKLYSIERRRERYVIIYMWKVLEGLVQPFNPNFSHRNNLRLGRFINVPPIIHGNSAAIKNIIEKSLSIRGPKLFNKLPPHLRNMTNVTVNTFKTHLDRYLSTIPDQPSIAGYVSHRASESNSLIHQIP